MPLTVVANCSGEYMQDLIAVQKLINDFAKVKRSVYMPESDDYENDVHHSFSLALLAWQIHDKLNLDLDVAKILKYALVHDLVEVYAGDTHAFSTAAGRKRKLLKEAESLKKLRQEFAELFPDLTDTMAAYDEGDHADDEAVGPLARAVGWISTDHVGRARYRLFPNLQFGSALGCLDDFRVVEIGTEVEPVKRRFGAHRLRH